ncbi:hypothetical protein AGR2A_Cc120010 [Agrobacterium genomosp. 2 str. CFBP 5494]|uniref:Uncharacterized protein n=1 Tax=Agrobacterium genomosp. 2 str. CFBP 5494 TaxID=1183436 RepID=A0A9W5EZ28_9HYPH|nr:hypothetical protein AGR2A_Cc120010 [Agrobacterium genomosp. 2 str. CFBP 5494]
MPSNNASLPFRRATRRSMASRISGACRSSSLTMIQSGWDSSSMISPSRTRPGTLSPIKQGRTPFPAPLWMRLGKRAGAFVQVWISGSRCRNTHFSASDFATSVPIEIHCSTFLLEPSRAIGAIGNVDRFPDGEIPGGWPDVPDRDHAAPVSQLVVILTLLAAQAESV